MGKNTIHSAKVGKVRSMHRLLAIAGPLITSLYAGTAAAQVDFSVVSDEAGVGADTYLSATDHALGVNWIDYDGDGWPDLFMVNGGTGDGAHLYHNEGNGTFSRADNLLPPLPQVEMMGSVFADYDNDGDSDVYIFTDVTADWIGPSAGPVNILLQNQWVENGGQVLPGQPLFVDVTAAAQVEDKLETPHEDGIAYRSSTGGWLDYDRDGNVDLYVCHWDPKNHGGITSRDRLYRNNGDGTFEDVSESMGLFQEDGSNDRVCLAFMGAHLDSDLWPDIYVGNIEAPDPWDKDFILQNNAGAGFTDRRLDSPGVGDDAYAAMGVTTADFNLDGSWDLYLSDLGGGKKPVGNPLYQHTGSDLTYNDNSSDTAGVQASNSWGVNFLDVDNDGYEDLLVGTMGADPNTLYMNNAGDGTFSEFPGGVGNGLHARGSAYADYDRDGDIDAAVVNVNGQLELLRNDTVSNNHWLQIQLASNDDADADWSNSDAIGTLVKVTANGKTHMRQVIGGDSGHGQNSLTLHFGLGEATVIDQIAVYWPSGAEVTLVSQAVDTFMLVSEQGASAALVSPLPGSPIVSETTLFEWAGAGSFPVSSWRLLVGTAIGTSDIYDSGSLAAEVLSAEVSGLPVDDSELFTRLLFVIDGDVHHIDYHYGTPVIAPPPVFTPVLESPGAGTTLTGSTETFAWSANGVDVSSWRLWVGSTPGGKDIFKTSLSDSILSQTVSGLPTNGSTVYVNLAWRTDGSIYSENYEYIANGDGGPPGSTDGPNLVAPTFGSELTGSTETFTWESNGEDVSSWRLWIGTAEGGKDILRTTLASEELSYVVEGLPTDGSTVYVQLAWRSNGSISSKSFEYTTDSNGETSTPTTPHIPDQVLGQRLHSDTETFSWSPGLADVDSWRLDVGTTKSGSDIYRSGLSSEISSVQVSGLPTDGSPVFVRLSWRVDGKVRSAQYEYQGAGGHSVARLWNEILLDAIRHDFARPTMHARNLWHISAAMFDSWSAYEDVAGSYLAGSEVEGYACPLDPIAPPANTLLAREEAVSYAAYRILHHRFATSPGYGGVSADAEELMTLLGYDDEFESTDYSGGSAAALGNYIASCYIGFGLQDGSNEAGDYANLYYEPVNESIKPFDPGNPEIVDLNRWQPIALPIAIDQSGNVVNSEPEFLSPEWGQVVPFSLTPADQTIHSRDGDDYVVYMDPGSAPLTTDSSTENYQWGFSLVSVWSAHLDPTDGVMIDISPASLGNMSVYPTDFDDYDQFYDYLNGGDASQGYEFNPVTGLPYEPQLVPRGDYARVLAEFWADGPDSETPPGHWFVILNTVTDHPDSVRQFGGVGDEVDPLEWDIKSYFTMGGAMHDSAVAAWSIKGWYDYLRPVSAIRAMADRGQSSNPAADFYHPDGIPLVDDYIAIVEAGDELAGAGDENIGKIKLFAWKGPEHIEDPETDEAGVGWILAENWWPYQRPSFVTPPFAGYISGHSTFSRAAAEVMEGLTGSAYFPGGMSSFEIKANEFLVFEEGPSVDLTLQWATYRDASDQTSLSRIWGGIHPPADDLPGRAIGETIGLRVFQMAEEYFSGER